MTTSRVPFVGRRAVLGDLTAVIDRACNGHGGVVLVSGDPGLGKSRLVEEAVALTRGRIAVGWGAGGPLVGAAPFGVWLQALRSLGGVHGDAGVARLTNSAQDGTGGQLGRLDVFDGVAAALRSGAEQGPVVIVIDDLHLADPSSLALLAFLAPTLRTAPIAVVATACLGNPGIGMQRRALLETLGRQADQIELGALGLSETAALVTSLTGDLTEDPLPDDAVETIHLRAGGNPLFVTELVAVLLTRGRHWSPDDIGIPHSVRTLVDQRLAHLSDTARTVLSVASVLGNRVHVDVIDDTAREHHPDVDVRASLRAAVEAELLSSQDGHVYTFTHEPYRQAIYMGLAPTRRRQLHAAASRVLTARREAGHDVRPAHIASHLTATGGQHDRRRAVAYLRAAATDATAVHAHEVAIGHLREALALARRDGANNDALEAELLLNLGDATLMLGDLAASRDSFARAAEAARAARRPDLLARAAIGMGSGEAGFEVPLFDHQQIEVLEEALRQLPASDRVLAARLRARLSVAAAFTEDEPRRLELCESAVATARDAGDDGVLAAALAAHCDAVAGPGYCEQRERQASEVIKLARGRGDLRSELLGRRLRVVARLEQGDMTAARADIDAFTSLADRLDEPLISWYTPLWHSMSLQLAGRADDAERATQVVLDAGRQAQSVNALQLGETQRFWMAIEAGDFQRLHDTFSEFERDMPRATWAVVALALAQAHLQRPAAARVLLDRLVDELPSVPQDSEWLSMLAQVAETVELVGPHPITQWTYEALLPFRHRHVVEGIGAVMRGSVERALGTLAAALGHESQAAAHFGEALRQNRRLGGAALVARTLRDAGVALRRSALLDDAAALYSELGWRHRIDEVRERLATLAPTADTLRTDAATGTFTRDGDGWELRWQNVSVRVRDAKGLHDLAWLLARPGTETPVLDLFTAPDEGRPNGLDEGHSGREGHLGPILDTEAREAYRRRLADLDTDIAEAEASGDHAARQRGEDERDFLVRELTAAYGLGGRARTAGDPAERARTTVTSRIRYAIERISAVHPALGQHLANSVHTGRYCSYTPEQPVDWHL